MSHAPLTEPGAVLGFETPSAWHVTSSPAIPLGSSSLHSQGTASLSVQAHGYVTIQSCRATRDHSELPGDTCISARASRPELVEPRLLLPAEAHAKPALLLPAQRVYPARADCNGDPNGNNGCVNGCCVIG